MSDGPLIFSVIMLLVTGAFVGGCGFERGETRRQAIKAGVGEFYLNEHHQKCWRWKTNLTAKP